MAISFENIKAIIAMIEKENSPVFLENVFRGFPFAMLMQCESMNFEMIKLLITLSNYFLDIEPYVFNTNNGLGITIEFALQNVAFLIKSENDLILPLLQLLTNIFSRLAHVMGSVPCNVDTERIGCLLLLLFKSSQPKEIKCEAGMILAQMLLIPKIISAYTDTIDECIDEYLNTSCNDDILITCKLVHAALGHMHTSTRAVLRGSVCSWLSIQCPKYLDTQSDVLVLYEILKCLSRFYQSPNFPKQAFSAIYVTKIHVLCDCTSSPSYGEFAIQILTHIIKDMCCVEKVLFAELDIQPLLMAKNIFSCDIDDVFIIIYLQCLYAPETVNKNEVAKYIIRRCHGKQSYSMSILKVVCFLFPIFVVNQPFNNTKKISFELIRSMVSSKCLGQILSYEPAQLAWLLTCGGKILKLAVLYLWLMNYKQDSQILAVVDACKAAYLFVDFMMKSDNQLIANRAACLLCRLNDPAVSTTLMRNIRTVLGSSASLGLIFLANPALPRNDEEGLFYCSILSEILIRMDKQEGFIACCNYCNKLLIRLKANPQTLFHFVKSRHTLTVILSAVSSADDKLGIVAAKLLTTLVKIQRLHGANVFETVHVDFRRILRGSSTRLSKCLLLLQFLIQLDIPTPLIGLKKESIMKNYQWVHGIEDLSVAANVYRTLKIFLDRYVYLALSPLTSHFVNMHCRFTDRDRNCTSAFVSFLKIWLTRILYEYFITYVPAAAIYKFVSRLRQSHEVVDCRDLMKLLDKWQVKSGRRDAGN